MFTQQLFVNILGVLALALGGWIGSRIKKPTDLERADLLAKIARAAAALVLSMNPSGEWGAILKATVDMILNAAGLPTRNLGAVERAAAEALVTLGRRPGQ